MNRPKHFRRGGNAPDILEELDGPHGVPTGFFFIEGDPKSFGSRDAALAFKEQAAARLTPLPPNDQFRPKSGRRR